MGMALVVVGACGGADRIDLETCQGQRLVYRLEPWLGRAATAEQVKTAVKSVRERLAPYDVRCAVDPLPESGTLVVAFAHEASEETLTAARQVVECLGTLEFRIAAPPERQQELSATRNADCDAPPGYRWIAWAEKREEQFVLVEAPEDSVEHEMKVIRKRKSPESPEFAEARAKFDQVKDDEVFTHADVASAEAQQSGAQHVVAFEIDEERKRSFAAFTGRHIGEKFVIIVDGRARIAPVIRMMLPGAGIIEGGGVSGFSAEEARRLAAVLSARPLPGRLTLVSAEAPK